MLKLNHHLLKLESRYLFSEVEKRVLLFQEKNRDAPLSNLGIGDITKPLAPSIAKALSEASIEMGTFLGMKGYGPAEGYLFLREKIKEHEYQNLGITSDEIFISDGAQSDMAQFQELFSLNSPIAIQDPTYPVYLDSNVMAGRTRKKTKNGKYGAVLYLPCREENGFLPSIPKEDAGLIYLCFPNNPTGVSFDKKYLQRWVDYAKERKALLLIDGAYAAYVRQKDFPKSIYEIEGADEVAVEFRTFSKSAGFTGLRCSYMVIPKKLVIEDLGQKHSIHKLWKRRQDAKFNGVAYPIQKAAEACFSNEGKKEIQEQIDSYLEGAKQLREGLKKIGLSCYGGIDSPYVWCKTPDKMASWDFFDLLLNRYQIISVPGEGFGTEGKGFVRFSGFARFESIERAIKGLYAYHHQR